MVTEAPVPLADEDHTPVGQQHGKVQIHPSRGALPAGVKVPVAGS